MGREKRGDFSRLVGRLSQAGDRFEFRYGPKAGEENEKKKEYKLEEGLGRRKGVLGQ